MRQSFRDADFDCLARLYNSYAPAKYALDADLIRFNTVESPLFDWGASCIASHEGGDGRAFIAVKRSAGGRLYKGPDPDQAHITLLAYTDPRIAIDLMADVKNCLRDRGVNKLIFGQDSRHFFPGCPEDFSVLHDFLMIEGFTEGGPCHDVERDLEGYVNPFPPVEGFEFRTVSESDVDSLERFFDREFPDRWKFDAMGKIALEGNPGVVFGMFLEGEVEGFALLQDWTHQSVIGGSVWRSDLGERWGSLGPIGISSRLRGNGVGQALLGAALESLRDRGCRRTIIDWTSLLGYYGAHGFEVARTYRPMSLVLGE